MHGFGTKKYLFELHLHELVCDEETNRDNRYFVPRRELNAGTAAGDAVLPAEGAHLLPRTEG